jgi:hypothetical protein
VGNGRSVVLLLEEMASSKPRGKMDPFSLGHNEAKRVKQHVGKERRVSCCSIWTYCAWLRPELTILGEGTRELNTK